MPITRQELISAVNMERARQDAKWGIQRHTPEVWLTILIEEVGELAKDILQGRTSAETEAIQCAAVIFAMLENGGLER